MSVFLRFLLDLSAYLKTHYASVRLENYLLKKAGRLRQKYGSDSKPKVAILGASFNPITLGHVDLIRVLFRHMPVLVQKIDLIPTAQSPLKKSCEYADTIDRLHMINLVLQTQFTSIERTKIDVLTLETARRSPSWMVMTLCALLWQHRGKESYLLVCGYDHILQMQQWYRWQELANLCELYFYPRVGIDILNMPTIQACKALCLAGIKMTLVFKAETEKHQFLLLYQEPCPKTLNLLCEGEAQIRACSATAIRNYYQQENLDLKIIPEGVTPEVHHYILTHHCY